MGVPSHTLPKAEPSGSSSRPEFYLLGHVQTNFKNAKVPTQGAVLGIFLSKLNKCPFKEALAVTRTEVKKIWLHFFGVRGKNLGFKRREMMLAIT